MFSCTSTADGRIAMQTKINPALLNRTDLARLREDFRYFDRNRDGLMQFDEFTHFLASLKANMSAQELHTGFTEIDTDRDGVIEFEEFVDWWGVP
jgi:Ca2+-binding EF-hand superfamily protein